MAKVNLEQVQLRRIDEADVASSTFIPLAREPILVRTDTNKLILKVGDGVNLIKDLPVINSSITGDFATKTELKAHTDRTDNPHAVTKEQLGLENVVNTGDSATPVSGGTTKFTTGGAYTELAKKQETLVDSGASQNIKTIGGITPLGTGDIVNYNIVFSKCETAAATQEKEIVLNDTSYDLKDNDLLAVNFTNSNTFSSTVTDFVTFKIGADSYKIYNKFTDTSVVTGTNTEHYGAASRTTLYRVDKTNKILYFLLKNWDNNTTYTNASLGQGYGTCATDAATAAKVVTLASYGLIVGGIVAVKFTYGVPAGSTMNINSKGAKAIYYKGAAIKAGVIQANDIGYFIYNGSQYILLGIDHFVRIATPNAITDDKKYLQVNKNATTGLMETSWQDVTATPASQKGDYFTTSVEDTMLKVQQHFKDPQSGGVYKTHWTLINHDTNYYQWWRDDSSFTYDACFGMRVYFSTVTTKPAVFELYDVTDVKLLNNASGNYQWVVTDMTGITRKTLPAYKGMVIQNNSLDTTAKIAAVYDGTWEQWDDGSVSKVYQYHCTAHTAPTSKIKSKVGEIIFSTTLATNAQVVAIYEGTNWTLLNSYASGGVTVYQWHRTA